MTFLNEVNFLYAFLVNGHNVGISKLEAFKFHYPQLVSFLDTAIFFKKNPTYSFRRKLPSSQFFKQLFPKTTTNISVKKCWFKKNRPVEALEFIYKQTKLINVK